MIDGIAQQVGERRFEFSRTSRSTWVLSPSTSRRTCLPSERPGREPSAPGRWDVGERSHPRGQRRVVEHLGALAALPGELVEIGDVLHEHLLAFADQLPRLAEHGLGLRVEGGFLDRLAYHVERAASAGLQATQALQGNRPAA